MNDNPNPPKKRKHSDAQSRSTLPQNIIHKEAIKQVAEFWFDDGNVVLQADLSQFRVHRGVLSRSSSIFKDMFSIPQPPSESRPSTEETVESCPVVHLQDSAHAVTCMLNAMYDIGKYDSSNKILFREVAALLRLGAKYDVPDMRKNALKRLRTLMPSSLHEFDDIQGSGESQLSDYATNFEFDAINLAHDEGIPSILPALYYRVLTEYDEPINMIFNGAGRVKESSRLKQAHISPSIQQVMILGRDRLMKAALKHTFEWLQVENEDCSKPSSCRSIRSEIIRRLWLTEPPAFLESALQKGLPMDASDLCADCTEYFEDMHEAGRDEFWDLLPTFFDLPKWEDLTKLDRW